MAKRNARDAQLAKSKTLPNGAAVATSSALDLGAMSSLGSFEGDLVGLLTAPALTVGELANAATMTYDIIHSDNPDLSTPTVYIGGAIVQTGAGGVGAGLATFRFRLPDDLKQYVGFRATNSGAGNCSGKSGLLEFLS